MKLKEIADKLGCKLIGDGEIEIRRVTGIKEAEEGDLTFVANPKYMKEVKNTNASAVIISHKASEVHIPSLRCDNPYYIFAKSLELFYSPPSLKDGIDSTAVISPTATIGKNPVIMPYSVIGNNVTVGDNAVIHPHVTIYENVTMGDNVIVHSNSVIRENTVIGNNVIIQNGTIIGGDGFAFAKVEDGSHYKMVQLGRVIIEDDVEIQCNSAVDRATVGDTVVKKGTKIDNFVQVGHGSVIGEKCILCGHVGLAGSTILGNNVLLAGNVGTAGHLTVGDNVIAAGKSGITDSIESNIMVAGFPAVKVSLWRKAVVFIQKLPELFKRVKNIEKKIEKFER